jgi:hypothetical protein
VAKVIKSNSGVLYIECPGCGNRHTIGSGWNWNGDYERPTITPSILVRTGHYIPKHQGSCWCTYNAEHPDDLYPYECFLCHSFVTDGRIQFLGDCTHVLAGQTVELPDID